MPFIIFFRCYVIFVLLIRYCYRRFAVISPRFFFCQLFFFIADKTPLLIADYKITVTPLSLIASPPLSRLAMLLDGHMLHIIEMPPRFLRLLHASISFRRLPLHMSFAFFDKAAHTPILRFRRHFRHTAAWCLLMLLRHASIHDIRWLNIFTYCLRFVIATLAIDYACYAIFAIFACWSLPLRCCWWGCTAGFRHAFRHCRYFRYFAVAAFAMPRFAFAIADDTFLLPRYIAAATIPLAAIFAFRFAQHFADTPMPLLLATMFIFVSLLMAFIRWCHYAIDIDATSLRLLITSLSLCHYASFACCLPADAIADCFTLLRFHYADYFRLPPLSPPCWLPLPLISLSAIFDAAFLSFLLPLTFSLMLLRGQLRSSLRCFSFHWCRLRHDIDAVFFAVLPSLPLISCWCFHIFFLLPLSHWLLIHWYADAIIATDTLHITLTTTFSRYCCCRFDWSPLRLRHYAISPPFHFTRHIFAIQFMIFRYCRHYYAFRFATIAVIHYFSTPLPLLIRSRCWYCHYHFRLAARLSTIAILFFWLSLLLRLMLSLLMLPLMPSASFLSFRRYCHCYFRYIHAAGFHASSPIFQRHCQMPHAAASSLIRYHWPLRFRYAMLPLYERYAAAYYATYILRHYYYDYAFSLSCYDTLRSDVATAAVITLLLTLMLPLLPPLARCRWLLPPLLFRCCCLELLLRLSPSRFAIACRRASSLIDAWCAYVIFAVSRRCQLIKAKTFSMLSSYDYMLAAITIHSQIRYWWHYAVIILITPFSRHRHWFSPLFSLAFHYDIVIIWLPHITPRHCQLRYCAYHITPMATPSLSCHAFDTPAFTLRRCHAAWCTPPALLRWYVSYYDMPHFGYGFLSFFFDYCFSFSLLFVYATPLLPLPGYCHCFAVIAILMILITILIRFHFSMILRLRYRHTLITSLRFATLSPFIFTHAIAISRFSFSLIFIMPLRLDCHYWYAIFQLLLRRFYFLLSLRYADTAFSPHLAFATPITLR